MTKSIRNVAVAPDPWNAKTSPYTIALRECADYRIHRKALLASGQRKSPSLPPSLLVAVSACGMRVDQIANLTELDPGTVRQALKRNVLLASNERRKPSHASRPLPLRLNVVAEGTQAVRRPQLLSRVPEAERRRLRDELYEVTEQLRALGLSFKDIAALAGRAEQTVHQWRIRREGNYPAPTPEIVNDLKTALARHEAVIARARTLLEIQFGAGEAS